MSVEVVYVGRPEIKKYLRKSGIGRVHACVSTLTGESPELGLRVSVPKRK